MPEFQVRLYVQHFTKTCEHSAFNFLNLAAIRTRSNLSRTVNKARRCTFKTDSQLIKIQGVDVKKHQVGNE